MKSKELDKSGRIATSIKIKPEIWKEAKIESIKRDVELSELVENALKKELKSGKLKGGKL